MHLVIKYTKISYNMVDCPTGALFHFLDYVYTRAKVSRFLNVCGFITLARVFGHLHYRGIRFTSIWIQCFTLSSGLKRFGIHDKTRKFLFWDSCFVCK